MYLRRTVAIISTGSPHVIQKKRTDTGEFYYQETPIPAFKTTYKHDTIRCVHQKEHVADSGSEGEEPPAKRGPGRPKKTTRELIHNRKGHYGVSVVGILNKLELTMRWAIRKCIPYNMRFPWRAGEHDFNTFTYFKAQRQAEAMLAEGIRPNVKYVAKLMWHVRHIWASVPDDHLPCDRGCGRECCKHYWFLRDHLVYMLQQPGLKTGVGLILRSEIPGAGKSKIFYWMWLCILGREFGEIMTKAKAVTSNFNARSERAKLTVGDDIASIKNGLGEEMLGLITQEEKRIEGKGKDAYYVPDFQEVVLLTNQTDPPVPIRIWDRRWFIIAVSCVFAHKKEGGIVPIFDEDGNVVESRPPKEYWDDFCTNYLTDEGGVHFLLWALTEPEIFYDRQNIPETEWSRDVKSDNVPQCIAFGEHLRGMMTQGVVQENPDKTVVWNAYQDWIKGYPKEELDTNTWKQARTAQAFGKMMKSLWGKTVEGGSHRTEDKSTSVATYKLTAAQLAAFVAAKKCFIV